MGNIDGNNLLESVIRWIHVIAGITWIGHLYFFNWVNSTFAPTLDAESKKKVVPELMPRALYFFRWGAAFTWITGVLLLGLVYYMNKSTLFADGDATPLGWVMVAIVFISPFIYEFLASGPLKAPAAGFWGGWFLASIMVLLFHHLGKFGYRGYAIHLGAMFGTIMAYNVWFKIWPAQRKIIAAVKNGEAPDAALAGMAGLRSKHNTFMSVPLIFAMVSQHATWAAADDPMRFGPHDLFLPLVILVGFAMTQHLYGISKKESPKKF